MSFLEKYLTMAGQISPLFAVGIAMAAGLLFNRLAKKVGLPNVTGYLISGLLIGKCVLRLLDQRMLASLSIVTTVALGFIAFSIGGEFKRSSLKKL
ncbi:MAG: cation:proton antiporter, partial [Clostridiales bacterium]|nr:cation:proton antiporter [Clostridiales bacterium]